MRQTTRLPFLLSPPVASLACHFSISGTSTLKPKLSSFPRTQPRSTALPAEVGTWRHWLVRPRTRCRAQAPQWAHTKSVELVCTCPGLAGCRMAHSTIRCVGWSLCARRCPPWQYPLSAGRPSRRAWVNRQQVEQRSHRGPQGAHSCCNRIGRGSGRSACGRRAARCRRGHRGRISMASW